MRLLSALMVTCVLSFPCYAQPNVVNIQTEGNLAPNVEFTGSSAKEVSGQNNPVDLARRAVALTPSQMPAALEIATAAELLARFDAMRVADRTAHQAWLVLKQDLALDQKIIAWGRWHPAAYQQAIANTIAWAEKSEPPAYYPSWMVQHGMGAVMGRNEGITPNVDLKKNWAEVIEGLRKFGGAKEVWTQREKMILPGEVENTKKLLLSQARAALKDPAAFEKELEAIAAKVDGKQGDVGDQFLAMEVALQGLLLKELGQMRAGK